MRLLVTWAQIHPAIAPDGRIEVGVQQAGAEHNNYELGRAFAPTDGGSGVKVPTAALDAKLAAVAPRSVQEFLDCVASCVETIEGLHTDIAEPRPAPEPEPAAP